MLAGSFYAVLLESVPWFRAMPVSGDIIVSALLGFMSYAAAMGAGDNNGRLGR